MHRLVMVVCLGATMLAQTGQRRPATCGRTVWGRDHIVVDLSGDRVRTLEGTVRSAEAGPVEGVLVEVVALEHSEAPMSSSQAAAARPRRACQVTGKLGTFRFALPEGRYEVLCSKPDWNSTSAIVVVARKAAAGRIDVPLKPGD